MSFGWKVALQALAAGAAVTREVWGEYAYLELKPSCGEVFCFRGIGSDEELERGIVEWMGSTHSPTTGDLIAQDWHFYKGSRADEEDPVPPGKRLRGWRKARGWSLSQLGSALGYSLGGRGNRSCPMISHIENGTSSPGREARRAIEELTGIPASAWRKN